MVLLTILERFQPVPTSQTPELIDGEGRKGACCFHRVVRSFSETLDV